MAQTHSYYRHSGRFEPTGPVLMALLGAVGAVVLGALYGPLIRFIPFIYLNALITFGFGIGVGYVVGLGAKWGQVRNMPLVIVFAAGAAPLLANYAGWVSWVYMFTDWEILAFSPPVLMEWIRAVAEKGAWSIGSGEGTTPTGIALYIVWVIEAGIIFGACIWARKMIVHLPFCEACKTWVTKVETLPKFAYILNTRKLTEQLEHDDLSGLGELELADPSKMRFASVELLSCQACRDMHLLGIKNTLITTDNKGKRSEKEDYVVRNLILPKEAHIALKAHGENLKKQKSAAVAAKAHDKPPEQEKEQPAAPEPPEGEAEKT